MSQSMRKIITGRLVMIFCREGSGKFLSDQIFPHEKSIDAHQVATDEVVAEFAPQQFISFQTGAKGLSSIPSLAWFIRMNPCLAGRKTGVVFNDHDARPK